MAGDFSEILSGRLMGRPPRGAKRPPRVEKYPEFIPWFIVARVRSRHASVLEVAQTVRFAGNEIRVQAPVAKIN